jgi:hypothetical protein
VTRLSLRVHIGYGSHPGFWNERINKLLDLWTYKSCKSVTNVVIMSNPLVSRTVVRIEVLKRKV